jgi:hypothetical protein
MFKGGTDPARELLGVPETFARNQGTIAGKRVFISESLNVAARERGFVRRPCSPSNSVRQSALAHAS